MFRDSPCADQKRMLKQAECILYHRGMSRILRLTRVAVSVCTDVHVISVMLSTHPKKFGVILGRAPFKGDPPQRGSSRENPSLPSKREWGSSKVCWKKSRRMRTRRRPKSSSTGSTQWQSKRLASVFSARSSGQATGTARW